MDPAAQWAFLLPGYVLTVLIETPILLVGLSPRHSMARRFAAGLWLTACTYPVVVLALPTLIDPVESRLQYLVAAETFAPLAECLLFRAAFFEASRRDFVVIVLANLASFLTGEALASLGLLP